MSFKNSTFTQLFTTFKNGCDVTAHFILRRIETLMLFPNWCTAKTNVNILTLYDVNSEQHLININ